TTDSVELKVVSCDSKMVFVPNTFTPNGDGLNDKLFVRGSGLRQLDYFRVFDRWGSLVFETHNMDQGWDGTIAGKPADVATYVYTLKGVCSSGSTVDKSGDVTLIR
ncbi:MAG: flagellar hook-length control protein FliK, partial [Bacteroidota bacterium]|nr:flagellar hook-length control protein FliK [Bacteroidota bacterium]